MIEYSGKFKKIKQLWAAGNREDNHPSEFYTNSMDEIARISHGCTHYINVEPTIVGGKIIYTRIYGVDQK